MPNDLRDTLTTDLQLCLGEEFQMRDTHSAGEGGGFTFPALHFSWWNRHGMWVSCFIAYTFHGTNVGGQGNRVPTDLHLLLAGKEDGTRTNYHQMLPYTSQDMKKHFKVYQNLQVVFQKVFEFMAMQVCFHVFRTVASDL